MGRIWLDDRKKAGMYHALSITMLNPFVMERNVERLPDLMSISFNKGSISKQHYYILSMPIPIII